MTVLQIGDVTDYETGTKEDALQRHPFFVQNLIQCFISFILIIEKRSEG